MFTIDILLQYSPMPIAVQRKEEGDAQALYNTIRQAMENNHPKIIELTCEKQPDKKIAVMIDRVTAVIVSQKSANTTGRTTGFLAVTPE